MKTDGASVAERIIRLKERVRSAARCAGRSDDSVRLLAVSKWQSQDRVRATYDEGLRDFAENYIQEALVKQNQLENLPVRWHFIGRIQSNKVKMLTGRFALIHSVDRISILRKMEEICFQNDCRQNVLLQFNVAGETAKGGASEAELDEMVSSLREFERISVQGLMVMPPFAENAEENRPLFRQAREKLATLRRTSIGEILRRHPLDQLSMGTTQDFEVAIEEGATWIRIGTDIFGPREEPE